MNVAIFVMSNSQVPETGTAHVVLDEGSGVSPSMLIQVVRGRHPETYLGQQAVAWWRGVWYGSDRLPPRDVCVDCLLAVLDGP